MFKTNQHKAIWNQNKVPVVLRRAGKGQKIRLRLPASEDNFEWLRNGRHIKPVWVEKRAFWEIPKAWFNDFVERSLERHGRVYIFQPYNEQEKCAPACQRAQGHECQCSCMGANHGAGSDGSWFEVSETFSFRWQTQTLACRLLTMKSSQT